MGTKSLGNRYVDGLMSIITMSAEIRRSTHQWTVQLFFLQLSSSLSIYTIISMAMVVQVEAMHRHNGPGFLSPVWSTNCHYLIVHWLQKTMIKKRKNPQEYASTRRHSKGFLNLKSQLLFKQFGFIMPIRTAIQNTTKIMGIRGGVIENSK